MAESTRTEEDGGIARLAVFDYDGTIIDGQSGSLFSRYLLARHLISPRTTGRLLWWGCRYKLHLPYRQDEARELIFRDLGSHDLEDARRIMRSFHDEVLAPRYRKDAVAEVRRRNEEGCVTLLISATFHEIACVAADDLGVDGFVATRMQLDANGHFTGRVDGEVVAGEGKCRAVSRWADEHLGKGAWTIAYAYGDHFTDEPLLAQAEHGFAVCPGKTLKSLAKRRDWPILDWR
ncbi:HAD family hydrolase [Olsenella uli]|uniref:HAD family hydrolase n=1 Tax=Olsenella uli TaxID=133926 RepID=UPI0016518D4C|nr:HAD family hydrolase [Olsenella uli]